MTIIVMTRAEGIRRVYPGPSHLVVLGAGASIASSLDNPEQSGKPLPSMANLVEVVGLTDLIEAVQPNPNGMDFETIYSRLHSRDPDSSIVREIEERVRTYFQGLTLPPTPTIYDYLVLSLRPKDLITTFNWDPFLLQAFQRNRHVAKMPYLSFLHGNVAIGYSAEDKNTGPAGYISRATENEWVPTKLLYPVTHKNYPEDEFIGREWERLERSLSNAVRMTVFGYGAPETDVEAVEFMTRAWGQPDERPMEQIEIIDVLSENLLQKRWSKFIYTGHGEYQTDYFNSTLALFPRRTGESFKHQFQPDTEEEAFQELNKIPRHFETLNDMWKWFQPLIEAEGGS